jgi:hypothetical protein
MVGFKKELQYAWHGSGRRWDAAWIGIVGGLIGGFSIWLLGIKVPQTILDNPGWGGVAAIALGSITGVIFVFVIRLCWAPFHFRLEPWGGFRNAFGTALGGNMWPVILMISGIACFVGLSGAGVILFVLNQPKVGATPVACKAANSTYNITRKLQAIDEIYAQLAGPMSDIQNEAGVLLNSFNSRVHNSTAIPDLETYSSRSHTVFDKFQRIVQSYDYFRDVYDVIIRDPSNFNYTSTESTSINLAHELQRLYSIMPDSILDNIRNSRFMSEWESAVLRTATWITSKQDALRAKRRETEATDICG